MSTVSRLTIPARRGKAIRLRQGQHARVINTHGQQVVDTWAFHSTDLHVIERYTPTGPDHMRYEVTIEDPKVFTRPWKMSMPLYRRQEANSELFEYQCSAYLIEQEWNNPVSPLFEKR